MTNRILVCLFAWGIMACAVSRWRVAGVGMGEGVLAIVALITGLRQPIRAKTHPVGRVWQRFIGLSVAGMVCGTLWAVSWGVWRPDEFLHDTLALAFCFGALSLLLPLLTEEPWRTYFCRQLLQAGIVLALLNLLLDGLLQQILGATALWIGRFNGLASNPNQLALYVGFLPFWMVQSGFGLPRWQRAVGLMACLGLGWLSGSEALRMAWFVGGLWSIAQTIHQRSWRADPVQNTHAKALFALLFGLLLLGLIGFGWPYIMEVYSVGEQGDGRFQRWVNGLRALAHSPLFGLGPGAFSGVDAPFDGQEAHNLYIDWAASGGLLAAGALLWFQYRVWKNLLEIQKAGLAGGFVALGVFSLFHYVARHPVFWVFQLLLLFLIEQRPMSKV